MNSASYNEILHYLKLDSVFYSRSSLGGDQWGIELPPFDKASMFHIVTSGSCIVEINGETHHLHTGDLVFISRALGHQLKGAMKAKAIPLFDLPLNQISPNYETINLFSDVEEKTTILCGIVRITHPAGGMLINEMPDIIVMRQDQHMFGDMMNQIVRLIAHEAGGDFIGGETVITRLADVLVIQAIRKWIEGSESFKSQWIQAIKHEQIGKALSCMHNKPSEAWTIESLGKEIGMSRTAFSNRFTEVVGESVFNYLTRWRMNLAAMRVKDGEKVDLDFVESLGYKSESAFRRTFKKVMGKNISEVKKEESIPAY
jgi:AraC-like DNA-binding protein/uncharacterized cupin superfamily protein